MSKQSRKSTPDIMSNLMGIKETEREIAKTINSENNNLNGEHTDKIEPCSVNRAIKHNSNKTIERSVSPEQLKEKTTFNLSIQTLEELDELWMRLRRKLKGEQRITKTLLVEKAIEIIVRDYESKSELSDIYKSLKV